MKSPSSPPYYSQKVKVSIFHVKGSGQQIQSSPLSLTFIGELRGVCLYQSLGFPCDGDMVGGGATKAQELF